MDDAPATAPRFERKRPLWYKPTQVSVSCCERHTRVIPRLLVSVRNALEAQTVLQVGCAIIDVKEPDHGPLGMASLEVCGEVAEAVAQWNLQSKSHCAVSLALGDAPDWESGKTDVGLPAVDYVKLGTAGLRGTDWPRRWRAAFSKIGVAAGTQRVIVAYADWQSVRAPDPRDVAMRALELGCRGMLIDTWGKSGGSVFDFLSRDELRAISDTARSNELWFALAGGLRLESLADVASLQPDVIGIRGAACLRGRRESVIDADTLRRFLDALM